MNKVVRKKQTSYTTISNVFLRDKNLSIKAKGFLAVVMGLPEKWDFSIKGICSILKEGKTAIYNVIQELKEYHYCETNEIRDEKGLYIGLDYIFYEEPHIDNPHQEYPHTENQDMDNEPQYNKEENSKIDRINETEDKEERDKSLSKKDELFEKCWIAYRRKGKKCKSKPYWNKLKEEEKQRVLPHIKAYVSANELRFQQDFERYLRDKTFDSIVIKGNDIIYDPACGMDAEYHPWGNASLMYNSIYKCYVYISYFDGTLCDGYTDDDRPDGASVVLNNGRGTIVWSKSERKWNLGHKSPWK